MSKKTIAVAALVQRIELAGKDLSHNSPSAPRIFIAALCGTLQSEFPDLARAVAHAAGMPHLYPEADVQ